MIYKKIDKIIVHADKTKQDLFIKFNIDKNKIEVIPHGLLEIKNEKVTDLDVYNKMNFNKIIISFLGNISIYKGIDYLINAWNSINTKINNIQLIIAGKGDLSKYKIISNKDNVIIDNRFLSDTEFYTYLKYSDIIILPYREISQSGVLLSALTEKKLIIATDKGGLGEPYKLFNLDGC
jgi:glycosyltransferase involved in cell wall biosynthesis